MEIHGYEHTCKRCAFTWKSFKERPGACGRCKSLVWDQEYKRVPKGKQAQQRQEGEDRMNPLAQQYLRDRMLSDGYPCEVRDGLNVALGNDPNLAALYPDYSQREMLSCAEDDHAAALHALESEGYDVRMVQLPRQSDGRAGGQVHIARRATPTKAQQRREGE